MAFRNFFPPRLIIPTSFQDCLTYGQQLLWLMQHKSPELVAGNNITLEFNDQDHTVTVNAEGGVGHTYHIDPESIEGGIEYRLIDENGDIQGFVFVPTVHTYSLDTIVDQETGYTQYCVVDENGTQCGVALEPHMVPAGGSQGQVLAKTSGADYAYGWQDASGAGGMSITDLYVDPTDIEAAVIMYNNDPFALDPSTFSRLNLTRFKQILNNVEYVTYGTRSGNPYILTIDNIRYGYVMDYSSDPMVTITIDLPKNTLPDYLLQQNAVVARPCFCDVQDPDFRDGSSGYCYFTGTTDSYYDHLIIHVKLAYGGSEPLVSVALQSLVII